MAESSPSSRAAPYYIPRSRIAAGPQGRCKRCLAGAEPCRASRRIGDPVNAFPCQIDVERWSEVGSGAG